MLLLLLTAAMFKLVKREPLPIRKSDLKRFQRLAEAASRESKWNIE